MELFISSTPPCCSLLAEAISFTSVALFVISGIRFSSFSPATFEMLCPFNDRSLISSEAIFDFSARFLTS